MPSTASCSPTHNVLPVRSLARAREGTAGRLNNPARSTCPRTSTLRISHFPDPHQRRYARRTQATDPDRLRAGSDRLTTEGSRKEPVPVRVEG